VEEWTKSALAVADRRGAAEAARTAVAGVIIRTSGEASPENKPAIRTARNIKILVKKFLVYFSWLFKQYLSLIFIISRIIVCICMYLLKIHKGHSLFNVNCIPVYFSWLFKQYLSLIFIISLIIVCICRYLWKIHKGHFLFNVNCIPVINKIIKMLCLIIPVNT
jgi:hypothetical protein